MKWVKDKDERKSLLRAFFQQEIFVVTQSLSRKDVNCDIQRLINKILRLWTLDWFLLTGSKPWSHSMKNCTLFYFSTNNLLNMTLPLIVLVQLECFEIFCVIKNIVLWNWWTFTIFRTCSNLHWHKVIFKCSSCPRQPHSSCLVVTVSQKHIQVQSPYKTFFTKPLSKVHTMHGYTHHDRQWAIPPFRQSPLHQPRKMQKKHDLSMQSGTLGVRQTKKSPTFVHVTHQET